MPLYVIRSALWIAFFGGILAAWGAMYSMATGLGLDLLGRPSDVWATLSLMDLCIPMDKESAAYGPLLSMWVIMMAAMMLPTLVPTLSTYEQLMLHADGTRAGWLGLVAGYALVWAGGSAVFAGLQLALFHAGSVDALGLAQSRWLAAGLLLMAGAYQFTRAKEACQNVCMSPMTYFLGHWRPDGRGGLRMGLGLGAYCVACCWAIMSLGFVGGVMNLAWMGLATLFMVLEKLPQIGGLLRRPAGAALIGAGIYVALMG